MERSGSSSPLLMAVFPAFCYGCIGRLVMIEVVWDETTEVVNEVQGGHELVVRAWNEQNPRPLDLDVDIDRPSFEMTRPMSRS
jgi:hypothetical protein